MGARYKSSYNPRYSLFIRITSHHEIFGGAYRDRTDDLLNAIIPNLSRASYSWKKYPAFLTAEDHQIFSALEVFHRRFGQVLHEARLLFIRQWKMYVSPRFRHKTITARREVKGTSVREK